MKMYQKNLGWLSGLGIIFFLFVLIIPLKAVAMSPQITNVTGGQFTVSWQTENICTGALRLYHESELVGNFSDERGIDFKGTTHYITATGLNENKPYAFVIESDGIIDDNNGSYYHVVTGPHIIPVGSIQPAGKAVLADGLTPASGAIVYVTIVCPEGPSAPLSTLVDGNGFWFIELINARKADCQKLYKFSDEHCNLTISVKSKAGSAYLECPIIDSQGGKKLYETLILK